MIDPQPVASPPAPPTPPGDRPPPSGLPTARSRRRGGGCLLPIILVVLFFSLLGNLLLGLLFVNDVAGSLDTETAGLHEKVLLGDSLASDKVAVVRLEGVITDSTAAYPIKQMQKAAKDRHVKAVVLRVDSPGGTVTASEELYQNVVNLRENNGRRFHGTGPKPVRVSFGGLAASGGYYVAAAGTPISAEPTTITGSIGVFAALPNIAKFAHEHGVKVELVKAGDVKASGSFFHDMTADERQTWQDTVDSAYSIFLDRVAAGRPLKKEQIRDEVVINQTIPVRDEKGNPVMKDGKPVLAPYTRKRADGGTYTAEQALKFGLIDHVEDLPATIRAAASAAGLSKYKAVVYDRPASVVDLFLGNQGRARQELPDLRSVSTALTPRLWYLTPTADGAILTPNP